VQFLEDSSLRPAAFRGRVEREWDRLSGPRGADIVHTLYTRGRWTRSARWWKGWLYANYMGTVEQALKQRGLLAGDGVLLAIFAALDGACSSS
jgi:hypothetical protein